jgi:hypothetical protein
MAVQSRARRIQAPSSQECHPMAKNGKSKSALVAGRASGMTVKASAELAGRAGRSHAVHRSGKPAGDRVN